MNATLMTVFLALPLASLTAPLLASARADSPADSQADPQSASANVAQERTLNAKIESVVLYQGRAAITRSATTPLTPGLWKIRFDDLPASIQSDTLEAKSSAGKILSVDFTERAVPDAATSPDAVALDAEIRKIKQELAAANDTLAGLRNELKVVESVGIRAASDATKDGGTPKLDLASLDGQLGWMTKQRVRITAETRTALDRLELLGKDLAAVEARRNAIGQRGSTTKSAEVLLAMTTESDVAVRLSYLVTDARWEPIYSIRAATERKTVAIEFDALVIQNSGEDWTGVRLSISTARPSRAANPPVILPWFVEILMPRPASLGVAFAPESNAAPAPMFDGASGGSDAVTTAEGSPISKMRLSLAEKLSEEAVIGGSGPSVTYTIALPFDAPSDNQMRRRARIANFDAPAQFIFQTQPVMNDGVFLRATLTNSSPFQLLPGRASVFVAADYVGATSFLGAAPNQEFDVFFGADPAVTARRELVKREDRQSGLFGGGLDTVSEYRVTLSNGTGQPIAVELIDRRPMSRSDKIEVNVPTLSAPLSKDPDYLATQFPQGIMRWDLTIAPTPTGSDGTVIAWTVVVSRSKDIEITPLPPQ